MIYLNFVYARRKRFGSTAFRYPLRWCHWINRMAEPTQPTHSVLCDTVCRSLIFGLETSSNLIELSHFISMDTIWTPLQMFLAFLVLHTCFYFFFSPNEVSKESGHRNYCIFMFRNKSSRAQGFPPKNDKIADIVGLWSLIRCLSGDLACSYATPVLFANIFSHNGRAILFIIAHAFIKRRRFSMHRMGCSFAIAAKCTTFIVAYTHGTYNIYINEERHRCHRTLHLLWFLFRTFPKRKAESSASVSKNDVSMLATREWVSNRG